MSRANLALPAFACVILAAITAGCFTGIESTPKITAENVREGGVRVTPEQQFASRIMSEAPRAWKQGKEWLVDDNKIALTFTSSSSRTDSIAGHKLSLSGIRTAPTLTGTEAVELELLADDGRTFYHRTGISAADWNERASYTIPFTVELSAVAQADSLMRGMKAYISTPRWRNESGDDEIGQRHVPVTVKSVHPGNHLYQLLVEFSLDDSKDPTRHYILMTFGPETSSTRNFDRLFSFTDPRKAYPQITDRTWEKIINSQITEGMTRDECRLALGTPAAVQRGATPGAQLERWSYENGVYLLFEDGYLTKFRM